MLLLQTCGTAAKIDESYKKRLSFFFCYQTLVYVAAGEPHPQPHYQTTHNIQVLRA
jgi:hypothetical protein